jgi:hypothetical protein
MCKIERELKKEMNTEREEVERKLVTRNLQNIKRTKERDDHRER